MEKYRINKLLFITKKNKLNENRFYLQTKTSMNYSYNKKFKKKFHGGAVSVRANFPAGNFLGDNSSGGQFSGVNFPGVILPGTFFLEPVQKQPSKGVLQKACFSQNSL